MPPHDPSIGADPHLGRRIDELERELSQARLRETATAEILRVISHSKADAQPVFDTIVRSALKLCDGLFSSLFQFDGILLHPSPITTTAPRPSNSCIAHIRDHPTGVVGPAARSWIASLSKYSMSTSIPSFSNR